MDNKELLDGLIQFQADYSVTSKGSLSAVIQINDLARTKRMPLDPDDFKTEKEGQVANLSGGHLKKILKRHGITRTLSKEGGRTSRGVMALMQAYVAFLNKVAGTERIDFDIAEEYWAGQIQNYFDNLPFTIPNDASKTITSAIDSVFEQVKRRQRESPGMQYAGTVLQHLVAAKLALILPADSFEPHGVSVADAPTDRSDDFVIDNTVIHCTTMTGKPLVEKWRPISRRVAALSSSPSSIGCAPHLTR